VPGRSPREAVKAYREPLQKNVSIICSGVLTVSNYQNLDQVSVLTLPDPISLNGRSDLYLSFTQQYKIVRDAQNGPYRINTRYYKYAIEDASGLEIFGYHWHPEGSSPIPFPHLHIGPGANVGIPELSGKAHFPTGRVAFEDVVEFLIIHFGVKPDRALWQEVLAGCGKYERANDVAP
jgi:hypothetical protein